MVISNANPIVRLVSFWRSGSSTVAVVTDSPTYVAQPVSVSWCLSPPLSGYGNVRLGAGTKPGPAGNCLCCGPRKHCFARGLGGKAAGRHLLRDEPRDQRRGKRCAVPPSHPIEGLFRRLLRRLLVGIQPGGIGVDYAFTQRVNLHPIAKVAKPCSVALVRR